MRRVRRTSPEARMELAPLIDVVFLLLTFFIFAIVLMVRADTLDIDLPGLGAGEPSGPTAAVTVVIDREGGLTVNGEAVERDALVDRVQAAMDAEPEARLLIAADEGGRSGDLLRVLDRLAGAGLGEFSVVGRPEALEEGGAGRGPE